MLERTSLIKALLEIPRSETVFVQALIFKSRSNHLEKEIRVDSVLSPCVFDDYMVDGFIPSYGYAQMKSISGANHIC